MSYEHGVNNPFTAEEIEIVLHALVAWAGNAAQTSRYLKAEKDLDISPTTLNNWKRLHGPRYDELREQFAEQMEQHLTHEMREAASAAVAGARVAVQRATEKLEAGKEDDPSRAAANLTRVAQGNVDKLLSLTGRARNPVDSRGVLEILRSLASIHPGLVTGHEVPQLEEPVVDADEASE